MKIQAKDFRVTEGGRVNLKKWPTQVKPVCNSKEQYRELLGEHVDEPQGEPSLPASRINRVPAVVGRSRRSRLPGNARDALIGNHGLKE